MELKELYYNYNFNYGTISVIDRFYTVKLYDANCLLKISENRVYLSIARERCTPYFLSHGTRPIA